jgi:hypothetical protein
MDAGLGSQTGDVVSHKKASAAEEYYRYMLLKEKLNALTTAGTDDLLKVQSEKEVIEMSILRKLMGITESSPEFSQVVDITGSRDRYEQARILAEVVYDKVRAETVLSFYTPSKEGMTDYFKNLTASSAKDRLIKLQPNTAAGAASRLGITTALGGSSIFNIKSAATRGASALV